MVSVTVCSRSLERAALIGYPRRSSAQQPQLGPGSEENGLFVNFNLTIRLLREVRFRCLMVQQTISFLEPEPEPVSMCDKMREKNSAP
jgi:hypothetical protein